MNYSNNDTRPQWKNFHLNSLNDYFIQVDYFDKTGKKKYNHNIPLKHIFNKKISNKN
jgi:hypothetical protein